MRVTNSTMHLTVAKGLQSSLGRIQELQSQLASGRRITQWSDAPADATVVLRLRAEEQDWNSYARAGDDATAWLNAQDNALQTAMALVTRAKELAISAGSPANTAEGREAIALELISIRNELAGLANTSYQGRSVFGGFANQAVSLVGGAWQFTGDAGQVLRQIAPQLRLAVNGDGAAAFGFGSPSGSIFAQLDQMAANVRSNNISAVSTTGLTRLDTASRAIGSALAIVGTRTRQVENAKLEGMDRILGLKASRSQLEDVDMAEATLNLQTAQIGYQAALGAAARLSLPSLASFLG